MRSFRLLVMACVIAAFVVAFAGVNPALAASARELDRNARKALAELYARSPVAREKGEKATAILVFPGITKGGFIVGGQYGEGVLIKDGKTAGYYNTVSASYGLQAGIQKYGNALFFMSDSMLQYLDKSGGWELGSAPSIVVADKGAAGGISTTSAKADAYAFFFSQKGLMGGLGLQGTKVTKIRK
jgi:lipid-binding SYLF domain-containing protein